MDTVAGPPPVAADATVGNEDDSGTDARVDRPADGSDEFEGSPLRRVALSLVVVLVLAGILSSTMPDSAVKTGLLTVTRPVLLLTGLDQRWGVFAPNPRLETSFVSARIDRADGTVGVVAISNDAGLGEYWDYRWRKYGEQLWTGRETERERIAFVLWVAERDREEGHRPLSVTLVRHTANNLPPGSEPDTGPWRDVPFFRAQVGRP